MNNLNNSDNSNISKNTQKIQKQILEDFIGSVVDEMIGTIETRYKNKSQKNKKNKKTKKTEKISFSDIVKTSEKL